MTQISSNFYSAKPFLRWVGGKSWLARQFDDHFASIEFNAYHEPFLGSGAIYFHLQPNVSFLSDSNPELINTYVQVRDNVEQVIDGLSSLTNDESSYYQVRSKAFETPLEKAIQFIYLNKTSFNGIYRVNLKGEYNVPYGGIGKKHVEHETLRRASEALADAELFSGDFECVLNNVTSGDLVFLDPPYTVSHNNNGFIKYNEKLFSMEDQQRLACLIRKLDEMGVFYILTNAEHEAIRDLFSNTGDFQTLSRASLIGGHKARRGQTEELMVTNMGKTI